MFCIVSDSNKCIPYGSCRLTDPNTHTSNVKHIVYVFSRARKVFMIFMEILHKFVTFMALPFRVLSLTLISPIELPLCVSGLTVLSAAHLLRCYVHVVCIVISMSICATKYSTKQSTKIHSFHQWAHACVFVSNVTFFVCKFSCFWWFFSWKFAFVLLFKISHRPKRCLKQVLSMMRTACA